MAVVSGALGLEEDMPMVVEGSSERKGCVGAVADVFVVALTGFLEEIAGDDGTDEGTGVHDQGAEWGDNGIECCGKMVEIELSKPLQASTYFGFEDEMRRYGVHVFSLGRLKRFIPVMLPGGRHAHARGVKPFCFSLLFWSHARFTRFFPVTQPRLTSAREG